LVFIGFLSGLDLSWTALTGGAVLMVVARRDTHEVLKLVDFHLLVFFAALFVVVEGLNGTALRDQIYHRLHGFFGTSNARQAWSFAFLSVLGSNVFSNVPFVLVAGKWIANFAQPELMWKVMALATTFAGNLTILGSVANIIVVDSARSKVEIGFWDYARVGIPVTILTSLIGMGILLIIG
jgi:Na+/H+ antiporter NhaD/arsenite permease-like protein